MIYADFQMVPKIYREREIKKANGGRMLNIGDSG